MSILDSISNLFRSKSIPNWRNNSGRIGSNFTGLGAEGSFPDTFRLQPRRRLDEIELTGWYDSYSFIQRIINMINYESLSLDLQCDAVLLQELKRIKYHCSLLKVAKFSRLYGGAIIFPIPKSGLEVLAHPMNLKIVSKVLGFRIYSKYQLYNDLSMKRVSENERFDEPEYYSIIINGNILRVHYTWCYRFNGTNVTQSTDVTDDGWGISVLEGLRNEIINYISSTLVSPDLMRNFVERVYTIPNAQEIAQTEGGIESLYTRVSLMDSQASVARIRILGENEKYEKLAASVSGFNDLVRSVSEQLSTGSGIPYSKLFGKASEGLNSTGEGDRLNWYNTLESHRTQVLAPCLQWMINIVSQQNEWIDERPASFDWEFLPLQPMNAKEEAQIDEIKARTREIDSQFVDGKFLFFCNQSGKNPTEENYIEWRKQNETPDDQLLQEIVESDSEKALSSDKSVNQLVNKIIKVLE